MFPLCTLATRWCCICVCNQRICWPKRATVLQCKEGKSEKHQCKLWQSYSEKQNVSVLEVTCFLCFLTKSIFKILLVGAADFKEKMVVASSQSGPSLDPYFCCVNQFEPTKLRFWTLALIIQEKLKFRFIHKCKNRNSYISQGIQSKWQSFVKNNFSR